MITGTFCFPKENIAEIYRKYTMEKVETFHVLTDTDSGSLKFVFFSDPNSYIPEVMFRDIIFEVITLRLTSAKDLILLATFDSSDNTSGTFSVLEKRTDKKNLGYYGTENINNPWREP